MMQGSNPTSSDRPEKSDPIPTKQGTDYKLNSRTDPSPVRSPSPLVSNPDSTGFKSPTDLFRDRKEPKNAFSNKQTNPKSQESFRMELKFGDSGPTTKRTFKKQPTIYRGVDRGCLLLSRQRSLHETQFAMNSELVAPSGKKIHRPPPRTFTDIFLPTGSNGTETIFTTHHTPPKKQPGPNTDTYKTTSKSSQTYYAPRFGFGKKPSPKDDMLKDSRIQCKFEIVKQLQHRIMAESSSPSEASAESEQASELVYVRGDDGSYRGWKAELLVEEITDKVAAKFLLCSYCRGVLREACLFEKDGKQEVACSLCIPKETNKQVARMNIETINEKHVYCPLKYKGCGWTNAVSEVLRHLEECELFPVACPLGCRDERGEVRRVERREVETHRTCCPMRTVKCEYCGVSVTSCEVNKHLEVCKEFPIPCPNKCGKNLKRKEEPNHLRKKCPLQPTECPYSPYGCGVRVERRNLDLHEKEEMHSHLKLTMLHNVKTETDLKLSMLHNVKTETDLRLKVTKLEKEIEVLRMSRGSLEWKINGVKNKISQKEVSFSVPFYVGLYKFQARIEWKSLGYFSCVLLFLHIMKGELDDTLRWPLRYKCSLVLFNQLDGKDNCVANLDFTGKDLDEYPGCFHKPITERNEGYSLDLILRDDLLQKKYSKDDSITFKISVEQILTP